MGTEWESLGVVVVVVVVSNGRGGATVSLAAPPRTNHSGTTPASLHQLDMSAARHAQPG